MLHIVHPSYKHKKLLKEALAKGDRVSFEDPSVFSPRSYDSITMPVGTTITCTNHPKRSWFASVKRKAGGWEVK